MTVLVISDHVCENSRVARHSCGDLVSLHTTRRCKDRRRHRRERRTKEAAVPGEIVHIEIPADDTTKSQEFWGSLFGWQFQANPGPFEYHTTQIGGQQGAAITNMEPGKRGTRPYFAVDDINTGAARVNELGGQANEPAPVPGMGWFSSCKDPHGNEFGLWQTDTSAPPPPQ
jgi:uncharacterized protein